MASPFYTAEHEAYREVVRRFVEKEIEPYAHEWDEAGGFPKSALGPRLSGRLRGPAAQKGLSVQRYLPECGNKRLFKLPLHPAKDIVGFLTRHGRLVATVFDQ